MSKQHLPINDKQAPLWQSAILRAFHLLLASLLILITGFFLQRFFLIGRAGPAGALGLLVLSTALAILLERTLGSAGLGLTWRYRVAVLIPPLIALLAWMAGLLLEGHPISAAWLLITLPGAFLGGLISTTAQEGLWENNSPPSTHIQEDVLRVHRKVIGLPPPTAWPKRLFDLMLAFFGLVLSAPLWLVCIFLIWFESPGPLLFVKNSVGKGGGNFHQFKLRTMMRGAEENTGPVLSAEMDQRVLRVGKVLRKTALDELPQLINILLGDMSFVGPRPQRTVLVHGYLQTMPEYAERHGVLPGLAGLAQVAGDYYLSPRQKLRFDRVYIRHAGLGFDLKLIGLAFLITFWYRWQKDWDGRLPRQLLHGGAGKSTS